MSAFSNLTGNIQGLGNLPGAAANALGNIAGPSFFAQLKPASYRGFSFYVLSGQGRFGRRNALHEYPYRDTPYVEDMGRAKREFDVFGYIVGDDVIARRKQLIDLVERFGDGVLIHPTFGSRTVALMDFSCNEVYERGRVFELSFRFIEQGARLFPTAVRNGTQDVQAAANASKLETLNAFLAKAVAPLQAGVAAASAMAERVSSYAQRAQQVVGGATSLFRLAASLPGEFGRLNSLTLGVGIGIGQAVAKAPGATLQSLTAAAVQARTTVATTTTTLTASMAALGPATASSLVTGAQTVVDAVVGAAPTPGDAVQALLVLAVPASAPVALGAALAAQLAAETALRRTALVALASSSATFVPASNEDALAVRELVLRALDDEVTAAGDAGEDAVFQSFRDLRTRTAAALNAVGAQAPDIRTIDTRMPLPSLVLAQRLYRDPEREAELVARALPVHPAFMPTRFRALAS